MPKQIFSVKVPHPFEQVHDSPLAVSINFNEEEIIAKINSILAVKNLKYKKETPLSYQYDDKGTLTITGIAESFNPDAPDFLFV